MKLVYTKVREVRAPERAHDTDAGIDFFVPEDFEPVTLKLGDQILIPCGIKVVVPHGYMLQGSDKSGVCTKRGLKIGAKTVDSDYRGEMHINLHKISRGKEEGDTSTIKAGDKIAQFILQEISLLKPEEITNEEYAKFENTERGTGGFGSSDKK